MTHFSLFFSQFVTLCAFLQKNKKWLTELGCVLYGTPARVDGSVMAYLNHTKDFQKM
jgi:hypothetical protein